ESEKNRLTVQQISLDAKIAKRAEKVKTKAYIAAVDTEFKLLDELIPMEQVHQIGIQTFSPVLPPLDGTCAEFLREIEEEKTLCDGTSPAASIDQIKNILPPKYFASIDKIQYEENNLNSSALLSKVIDFIIPSASAEFNVRMIGLAAIALAAVIFVMTDSSPEWARWMGAPSGRASIYMVATILAGAAGAMTLVIIKEIEDYIEELEKIINKLKGFGEGVQTAVVKTSTLQNLSTVIPKGGKITIGVSGEPDKKFPCIATNKNGKCRNLQGAIQNNVGFSSLPGALQQNANNLGEFGNNIQGTNSLSAGALEQAQNLAAQSNAIRKQNRELLKTVNQLNKKRGNPGLGIERRAGLMKGNLGVSILSGLKKNGLSPKQAIASLGGAFAPRGRADTSDKALAAGAKKYLGVNNSKAGGSFNLPTRGKNNFNFDLDSDEDKSGQLHSGAVGDATGADGYSNKNAADIVDSKDTSIFEIIHIRYLKSAYPTLLEEDK
ncbi:MAG: hypothetical protein HN509_13875, partial [Halobacteriovoraceae bacterium]|nr:hypothetical protein [Halobacteriovoraceae bacterium]